MDWTHHSITHLIFDKYEDLGLKLNTHKHPDRVEYKGTCG